MDVDWSKSSGRCWNKVHETIKEIQSLRDHIQYLYIDYSSKPKDEKHLITQEVQEIRSKCIEVIQNKNFNSVEVYLLLKEIDKEKNKGYARTIFDILFATGNKALYEAIRDTSDGIYKLTKRTTDCRVELFGIPYFKQKIG